MRMSEHEHELLAALESAVDQIEYLRSHLTPKWRNFTRPSTEEVLRWTREAIAKAKP
jgi:hypothetical protein